MITSGYHPSCLEVHDRWVGIQNNPVEEEEEDNVSRKVNINMDIGNVKEGGRHSSVSGRAVSRSHSQPSHHVRARLTRREAARTQYLVSLCMSCSHVVTVIVEHDGVQDW